MTFRNFYDPHFKPDRTSATYRSDQKKDAMSAQDNAAFVSEFLATWRKDNHAQNAAEVFKALRVEAARQSKLRTAKKAQKTKTRKKSAEQNTKKREGARTFNNPQKQASPEPSIRLKLESSKKYLNFIGPELLTEISVVQDKIDRWSEQHSCEISAKRKAVLAGQIQLQYQKRHDLLSIIHVRVRD